MITLNEEDFGTAVRAFEKGNGHVKKFPASYEGKYELSKRTIALLKMVSAGVPMSSSELAKKSGYKMKDVQNSLYQARSGGLVHTVIIEAIAKWSEGPKPRGVKL